MNLAPMSYRDYVWPQNPENIRLDRVRSTAEFRIPGGSGVVQENGFAPRKAAGGGRFCGAGCAEEFTRLSAVFAAGGSGMLRLPGEKPFQAVFSSLVMKGIPRPGCVEYEFVFLEDASSAGKNSGEPPRVYVCAGGENLWEIANRFGTDIDTLRTRNPQMEAPDRLSTGDRIVIA